MIIILYVQYSRRSPACKCTAVAYGAESFGQAGGLCLRGFSWKAIWLDFLMGPHFEWADCDFKMESFGK